MKIPMPDRSLLKAHLWEIWDRLETDQKKGLRNPPLQKPILEGTVLIDLVSAPDINIPTISLQEAIQRRRSRRTFSNQPLRLEELSFLLWAT